MASMLRSESRRLYSWWWDSHIPKNSKWLQENLTDMDAKVKAMIKLIEEDADSFARRAEMYYKKRPELIKLVEEFYRAYRALAERYDHVTGELQHAHKAMAEVNPNQIPFLLVEDSPSPSRASTLEADPCTPEILHPARALLESDAESSEKGLKQFHQMIEATSRSSKFMDGGLVIGLPDVAEFEVQSLKTALTEMEAKKESLLVQYEQCQKMVSDLEKKIVFAEEHTRLLEQKGDDAEAEIKKLKKDLLDLNEEKELSDSRCEECLEKISKLESQLYRAQEEVKNLNGEIVIKAERIKTAEDKCHALEVSNQSLHEEVEKFSKLILAKDQELLEKLIELENHQKECLSHSQIEASLQLLQNLHSQSQQEQRALVMELKNGLQVLKDLETCKGGLEDELQKMKDENRSLNESNLSSTATIQNLENEILNLRKMKERLEEEVSQQIGKSNSLLQEITCLKDEICRLNRRYQDLVEQMRSVGLDPESFCSSIRSLQEENSKLREISGNDSTEKEDLDRKVEAMDELLKDKAVLECSVSALNNELQELHESCHSLQSDKSVLVSEKASLLSQLQIVTENMQKLLEKNAVLENTFSGAKVELEGFREKSKGLEEICQLLKAEKSNLLAERSSLVLQLENVEQRLKYLEKGCSGLEERHVLLERERESMNSQVQELRFSVLAEKQEHTSHALQSETRMTSLESLVRLLQEEGKLRKKECEEELEKLPRAHFEIFILQKFIKEMEEKNHYLMNECHKHIEASKLADELISELENENLEQQVEMELLMHEIGRLRVGIYNVFKALETSAGSISDVKIENEQFFLHHIFSNIEGLKCSLIKQEDDNQELSVENSVLLTLLEEVKFDAKELELQKRFMEQEFRITEEKLVMVQNDKCKLLEMNKNLETELEKANTERAMHEAKMESLSVKHLDLKKAYLKLEEAYSQLLEQNNSMTEKILMFEKEKWNMEQKDDASLLEILNLLYLSTIFRSICNEKSTELASFIADVQNLQGEVRDLVEEVGVLREKLEMKEEENSHLDDTIQKMEMELEEVRNYNLGMKMEILSERGILREKEAELLEMEQKFHAAEFLNFELHSNVDELKQACQESVYMKNSLERQVLELSGNTEIQSKEIEFLKEENTNLARKLDKLHAEMGEKEIWEKYLSSELQERTHEFELWEAEAESFYFDLQISSIHEVFLGNKIHEVSEAFGSLMDQNASKSLEIEVMNERMGLMENEIEELKMQVHAYSPVIASLEDDISSLENITFLQTKLITSDVAETKAMEDKIPSQSSPIKGAMDLQKLRTRIKAVEKVVGEQLRKTKTVDNTMRSEIEALLSQHSLDREIYKLRDREESREMKKKKPKSCEVRIDDQMLELWETAAGCSPIRTVRHRDGNSIYNHLSADWKRRHPPADMEVKELGVDKLELSQEINSRKILQRLSSDAEKLMSIQATVDTMRRRLETTRSSRKPRSVDFDTVKEQLQEVEETVDQLVNLNSQLMENTKECSYWNLQAAADARYKRVTEQARKGSEKIGRLQMEVQKIQYVLLKLEDEMEKKGKSRSRFSKRKTGIVLKDFIYIGRRDSEKRKKEAQLCGCFRPSRSDSVSYV